MVSREQDGENMRNLKYNMLLESSEDPPETQYLGGNIFDQIELWKLNTWG